MHTKSKIVFARSRTTKQSSQCAEGCRVAPPEADSSQRQYAVGVSSGRNGQGLLEMIIAIGILTTGLLSTITLTTASLAATKDSETRLVATNLSREGIEVVRALRDTNWIIGQSWNTGLFGLGNNRTATLLFTPGGSSVWTLDFSVQQVSDLAATVFLGVTQGSLYEQVYAQTAGGTVPQGMVQTAYSRLLSLFPICRDNTTGVETVVQGEQAACGGGATEVGLDVLSTVVWNVKRQQHTVTTEEKIYDWR